MTEISPEALMALRGRISFRLAVGVIFGLLVAGVAALVGLVVDAVGPTVPFWVPIGVGLLAAAFYVVSARPPRLAAAGDAAPGTFGADTSTDTAAQAEASAAVSGETGLVPLPNDLVRLLSGRQIRVLGEDVVRMVMAPGQRIGLIAAAHLDENPDAVASLGSVVAATRDELGLAISAVLVDLDGAAAPERHDMVTVTGRAGVAAAAQKLPKFSASQLMALAARAR